MDIFATSFEITEMTLNYGNYRLFVIMSNYALKVNVKVKETFGFFEQKLALSLRLAKHKNKALAV